MRWLAFVIALLLVPGSLAEGCSAACFDGGGYSGRSVKRAAPKAAPRPTPRPAPRAQTVAASLGLHRVNQVWAGDVVKRSGPVTTYTSKTVRQDAGTYAKKIAQVGSGQKSAYDAALSNKRTKMTDGRAVSGDIYANYVWTGTTLKLDRYVFFQDDREVARRPTPAPVRTAAPLRTAAPARTPAPRATPRATPRPPVRRSTPRPRARAAATPRPVRSTPRPAPATPRPTATPPPRAVIAYVALAAQGDALARIEVLRGRRVDLWPRALVDGTPGRVASWTLAAGEVSALGATSGAGDQPFAAMWESVSLGGIPFGLRFDVTVDVPGEGQRRVDARIEVLVRSPAIVE